MKIKIMWAAVLLSAVLSAFSACTFSAGEEETFTEGADGSAAAYETEETTAEAQTVAELVRPPRPQAEYFSSSTPIEETDDTVLAKSFVKDYFYAKDFEPWADYIDLDKYFDNEYLKAYVRSGIEACKAGHSSELLFYEIDRLEAIESKKAGDINYICVAIELRWIYEELYPDWSGTGESAVIGIRDGKVVNLSIYNMPAAGIAPYWDESFDDWKTYDFTEHENPWDNEEYAKKILEVSGINAAAAAPALRGRALSGQ